MKLARIFVFSVLICFLVSILGSFLMVRYVYQFVSADTENPSVSTSASTAQTDIAAQGTISKSPVISPGIRSLESGVKAVASNSSESVVSIIISKEVPTYQTDPFGFFYEPTGNAVKQKIGGGTGFFVSKDGYILTNKHVVGDANAEYSIILANGQELMGKVLATDPTTDLALIRAFTDKNTPYTNAKPLSFVDTQWNIEIGSFVVAVGNALAEFQNTVTLGVISGLGRQIEAADQGSGNTEALSGLIQTDAAINPGNSGGPLINLAGQVVGINTAVTAGANGIGFAIPLSQKTVDGILTSVIKTGQIKRAFIGIRYSMLTPDVAKQLDLGNIRGAIIGTGNPNDVAVLPGSPGEKAGLKTGDVIVEADWHAIGSGFTLSDALVEKMPGDKVVLKVYKKATKKVEVVELTLAESR